MEKEYPFSLAFDYNARGYGDLVLYYLKYVFGRWRCRTGSINKKGKLVNAIPPKKWYIIGGPEEPAASEYDQMYVRNKPGRGWKWRLGSGSYLLHPDGRLPGSRGCIVTQQTNAMDLLYFAQYVYTNNPGTIIEVKVSKGG